MNKKVRILQVLGSRPTGGVGAVVYNYHSNFTNKDLIIDYLIFSDEQDGDFDQKVKKLGANVYILPALKYSRLFKLSNLFNCFLKNRKEKYDILHLHSVNIGFLVFPIAKKNKIEVLISHSHATMYSDKKINSIRNYILCLPLKKISNVYFSCSNAAGEFLYGKSNVDRGNVIIINNAIDCEKYKYNIEFRNQYRKLLDLNNKFVIGNVGRFNEQKNHKFLIDIFYNIQKIKTDSVLLLVGEGPLLDKIKNKVINLGIEDNVIFLGKRNDIDKILQAMDVFVLPSLYEGLPVIGIEAQTAGLPCFISDNVTKEVGIANVTYKSLQQSAQNWANDIVKFYDNYIRKDETKQMIHSGFDIKVESKRLEQIYIELKYSPK